MPVETGHPKDALILLVIPESRSDIRDPAPLCINLLHERHWVPAFAGMTKIEVDQSIPKPPEMRRHDEVGSPTTTLPGIAGGTSD
jgi:hypothetical protein